MAIKPERQLIVQIENPLILCLIRFHCYITPFFGSQSCGCGGFCGCGFHICSCNFGSIVRWNHFFIFSSVVIISLVIVIIVIITIYYYDFLSVVQVRDNSTMY